MVQREFTGSIMDKPLLERILSEFEVETVYHLAALLSTRSEFTPMTAHQVNVEGTLNLLEFSQHEAESHGRPVTFLYPSSIAAYGLPDLDTKAARRPGEGRRLQHAVDDVRVQQVVLRAARPLLREVLQAAGRRIAIGPRRFSQRAFPGFDLGDDRAVGRHLRLRAGDDSRGGARARPMRASCGPTRAFRSWRCPTASTRCCKLAAAPKAALTRTAYNLSAFNPSADEVRTEVVARVSRLPTSPGRTT